MSELTLLLLRLGFLALLWGFIFAIVYAMRTDLFGARVRKLQAEAKQAGAAAPVGSSGLAGSAAAAPQGTARGAAKGADRSTATRLVITSGPREGQEIALGAEPLTIGRSVESGLVIRDDYTSTHHARLSPGAKGWTLTDLDSTNGTFLDESRIGGPVPVPLNTPIRVGTTRFELRS